MDPRTWKGLNRVADAHQKAAEKLVKKTAESYPIGRRVAVTISHNVRIIGEITAAGGNWWHHPDCVTVVNVATGKTRHFPGADTHGMYKPELLGV